MPAIFTLVENRLRGNAVTASGGRDTCGPLEAYPELRKSGVELLVALAAGGRHGRAIVRQTRDYGRLMFRVPNCRRDNGVTLGLRELFQRRFAGGNGHWTIVVGRSEGARVGTGAIP